MQLSKHSFHLLAFLTATVWGITFISTKVLLKAGLSPAQIFLFRFAIAYILLFVLDPRIKRAKSWRDELAFAGVGVLGGSVYFLTENTALDITLASNVALIVTTAPLLTAVASHFLLKGEQLNKHLWTGAAIAFIGVGLVVFNGNFILKISPVGDLLSLSAALSWAFYSVLIKKLGERYPMRMITRRVFFYGIITIAPWILLGPPMPDTELLMRPEVGLNLIFLGVIASCICYIAWNIAIKRLGTIRTNNYIYFIPVVTVFASAVILDERLTVYSLVGAALIMGGVYKAERRPKNDL